MSPANRYFRSPIPDSYAGKVADILSEHAGARLLTPPEDATSREFWRGLKRADFLYHATRSDDLEYRFQGELGFGGKFRNYGHGWTIDCYPEDETPARRIMIERTNAELAKLYDQFLSELGLAATAPATAAPRPRPEPEPEPEAG